MTELATASASGSGWVHRSEVLSGRAPPTLLRLTEWEQRPAVHMSVAAVSELRRSYAKQIDLTPSWDAPGTFDLTARGYIGAIALDGLQIVLEPKVPLNTAVHMLAVLGDVPPLAERVAPIGTSGLTDLVARWFVGVAGPLVERKLLRRYQTHQEETLFVRGQIDVVGSLRLQFSGRPTLDCRFDEYTADVLENQILLAAALTAQQLPGLGRETASRLRRMVAMLSEVTPRVPAGWERSGVILDRLSQAYEPSLALANWILERASPELGKGYATSRFQAFLIGMSDVFQRYVTKVLAERLPAGFILTAEPGGWLDTAHQLTKSYPDIVVRTPGGEVVVLDTKYKNLAGHPRPSETDVYQVVTYCVTRGSRRGVLVYPASGFDTAFKYEIVKAGIALTCFPLDLGHGPAEVAKSIDRLATFCSAAA